MVPSVYLNTLHLLLKYAIFFILLISWDLSAQNIVLKVIPNQENSTVQKLNYKKKFSNTPDAYKEIENIILSLQYKGYLLAAADSIYSDSVSVTALISEGQLYKT